MALVNKIHIHKPKKIRFEEDQVKDTKWVSIFADDLEVVLFGCDLEDIRAGLPEQACKVPRRDGDV